LEWSNAGYAKIIIIAIHMGVMFINSEIAQSQYIAKAFADWLLKVNAVQRFFKMKYSGGTFWMFKHLYNYFMFLKE